MPGQDEADVDLPGDPEFDEDDLLPPEASEEGVPEFRTREPLSEEGRIRMRPQILAEMAAAIRTQSNRAAQSSWSLVRAEEQPRNTFQ